MDSRLFPFLVQEEEKEDVSNKIQNSSMCMFKYAIQVHSGRTVNREMTGVYMYIWIVDRQSYKREIASMYVSGVEWGCCLYNGEKVGIRPGAIPKIC